MFLSHNNIRPVPAPVYKKTAADRVCVVNSTVLLFSDAAPPKSTSRSRKRYKLSTIYYKLYVNSMVC